MDGRLWRAFFTLVIRVATIPSQSRVPLLWEDASRVLARKLRLPVCGPCCKACANGRCGWLRYGGAWTLGAFLHDALLEYGEAAGGTAAWSWPAEPFKRLRGGLTCMRPCLEPTSAQAGGVHAASVRARDVGRGTWDGCGTWMGCCLAFLPFWLAWQSTGCEAVPAWFLAFDTSSIPALSMSMRPSVESLGRHRHHHSCAT